MKKKSDRAQRVMERLVLVHDVENRVKELREEAGLPKNGFNTSIDSRTFFTNTKYDYTKLFDCIQRFIYFAEGIIKKMSIDIRPGGLKVPLHTYFILNSTTPVAMKEADITGCSIENLHSEDTPVQRMLLPAGVYIRLGRETTLPELSEFAQKNIKLIKTTQGLPRRKSLRPLTSILSPLVKKYADFTLAELQQMTGSPSTYKHILVARAIEMLHGRKISSETVKTYLKRQRKRARGDI